MRYWQGKDDDIVETLRHFGGTFGGKYCRAQGEDGIPETLRRYGGSAGESTWRGSQRNLIHPLAVLRTLKGQKIHNISETRQQSSGPSEDSTLCEDDGIPEILQRFEGPSKENTGLGKTTVPQ